jgi:Flp pilus assembly protein TadD
MNRVTPQTSAWPMSAAWLLLAMLWPLACREKDTDRAENGQAQQERGAPSDATSDATDRASLIERNNRGVGLMGMFRYAEALDVFAELVRQYPDELDVKVNQAIATLNRQEENDEQLALTLLDDVLSKDPDHLRANYCSGLLRLYLGETREAFEHFKLVADADANDPFAAYYLGQCMEQSGDMDGAARQFERALQLDPYLRSAYYRLSQVYQRLGRVEEAAAMRETFSRMEHNPRAKVVKFIYTRMGSKGEATALDSGEASPPDPLPEGPLFAEPRPLLADDGGAKWLAPPAGRAASITAVDLDRDDDIDIFIAGVLDEPDGVKNAVCINRGDGSLVLDREHVLCMIPDIYAALWGDYDNDGHTDVYLCRRGRNMLWRQQPPDNRSDTTVQWQDVTEATMSANGEFDTVDGAMFDADHDGDLDLFCVNADGPNELLSNNADGTFRPIAKDAGIAGDGRESRQVLPVDLESDRDLDIVVINAEPPHDVFLNDRLWAYRLPETPLPFIQQWVGAMVAVDCNATGELKFVVSNLPAPGAAGNGPPRPLTRQAAVVDFDGDGRLDEVAGRSKDSLRVSDCDSDETKILLATGGHSIVGWAPVTLHLDAGASIVAALSSSGPIIWPPGPGRHQFATLQFTGREVISDNRQLRSNASGIGARVAVRFDSTWTMFDTLRQHSGPGQSLQPFAVGLGGRDHIDFVALTWPDGVFQSEVHGVSPAERDGQPLPPRDFRAGSSTLIEETERQVSSCPVLFAWNGTKYEFVTDLLGVGGIGYMLVPGSYAPSRPWENVLLPPDLLQPRDGMFELKLGEPMEEACYLDSARLVGYDLPPGWSMTLDERMGISDPQPTGEARFYREPVLPVRAVNDRGDDVTAAIRGADRLAAPVGEIDHRFTGRLAREHVLTLEFQHVPQGDSLHLIIDGWIEYPYSQTMFGAWQAGATFDAPTLEARSDGGPWQIVIEQFGYPAGMPRQMSMPIPIDKLPPGARELRLRTNQEIYFDRVMLAVAETCDEMIRHELPLDRAALKQSGFAKRTTGPQRQPYYDYDRRSPFWDSRHQRGSYTQFGDCTELLAAGDDALAIFGPGEESHMWFRPGQPLPPLQAGWTRRFVLETWGWCKDMDLFTNDGDTVEPLPGKPSPIRESLHRRFNTRFESGVAAGGH